MSPLLPRTSAAPHFPTPRRARRSTRAAATVVAGVLLGVTGVGAAQADDIFNALEGNVDANLELVPLVAGGATAAVELYVVPIRGDGVIGCNVAPDRPYTVEVYSTRPEVASVTPSQLTFTSCADRPTITVTPLVPGLANVRLRDVPGGNATGGTFRLGAAAFSVPVSAAVPNKAPTITVVGVADGARYPVGQVPAAECQVQDEDGTPRFPVEPERVTGPYAADGIGSQTVVCSWKDSGGLTATAPVTYEIVDPTAPVVAGDVVGDPDGQAGWYTGDVPVDWTVDEPESPTSLTVVGCEDGLLTEDGAAVESTCTADSAGGTSGPHVLTVARDATAPTVQVTEVAGTRGAGDWYTSPVTATFAAQDATSGVATAPGTVTTSGEGAAVSLTSPAFSDVAGNTTPAGAADAAFAVDLTNPVATFDRKVPLSVFGKVPAAPTCTATDAVSGPAGCVVTGYGTTVGTHTLTATATDGAGRTATATQSYTVLPWYAKGFEKPVDMRGVLNVVKAGRTVPVRFELFAGYSEITSTASVTMSSTPIACNPRAKTDRVEDLTSGGTSLTYDTRAGKFLYRWKTPAAPGTCHRLTMTAADGSTLHADFKLKKD